MGSVSSDIAWAVIRDSSCFLLKKRGVKKPFSTEPCNLINRNSMRYNGLVNGKVVGISPAADAKGFVLTTKKAKKAHRPGKSMVNITIKAGLRRASAICRSQKPIPARKGAKAVK